MTNAPVLVLGASGALGSRIAERLAAQGHTVMGTASTYDSLARIPASVAERVVVDLTDAGACDRLAADIAGRYPALGGVVLATGRVGFAPASEPVPAEVADRMLAVNYLGPARVLAGLFPALQAGEGFVLGITGVVVEQPFPGMSLYAASKAALSMHLQVLTREWRRYKVRVTEARLGHTETGLATRPLFGAAPQMPEGHDPDRAVAVMLEAVAAGTPVLASTDFTASG